VKGNRRAPRRVPLVCLFLVLVALLARADDGTGEQPVTAPDSEAEESAGSAESASPGLSSGELASLASRYSPEYTRPVLNPDGSPLAVYHDLNGDGLRDVAVLAVLAEQGVSTDLITLRETSRLFRLDGPRPLFVVESYFAGSEAVQTVELGRRAALGGMELLHLSSVADFPVAVAVQTRGTSGGETNLLVFSEGGAIRRLELHETARERFQMVDLDEDGRLDIVVTRSLPEAGRGYETFVEYWTLDDGSYAIEASFGIVRELQNFLDRAAGHMVASRWEELQALIAHGQTEDELLSRAFRGVPKDEETEPTVFDYRDSGAAIKSVTLPIIRENPFPYPYLGTHISLVFRAECCDANPRFFSAVVALLHDPFSGTRFAFLTDN